jgi:ribosome-associated toxin RatA of RatAB toxin-antitoxin module
MSPQERILSAKMDGLKELIEEKFKTNDKVHTEMKTHMKETNGSVKELKIKWAFASGAIAVVVIVLVPVFVDYLKNHL